MGLDVYNHVEILGEGNEEWVEIGSIDFCRHTDFFIALGATGRPAPYVTARGAPEEVTRKMSDMLKNGLFDPTNDEHGQPVGCYRGLNWMNLQDVHRLLLSSSPGRPLYRQATYWSLVALLGLMTSCTPIARPGGVRWTYWFDG